MTNTIAEALEALQLGRPVVVVDDEGRENEGDLIIAAERATAEWVAFMVRYTSGYLCAPLTGEIADRLELTPMVMNNQDSRSTAYTISVDAADRDSTGISADDRAHTARVLADPEATAASVIRPGHVIPLRAVDGGVRERAGHTEAGVELTRMAGLQPVALIGELVQDNGELMRMKELLAFSSDHDLPLITIEDLIAAVDAGEVAPEDAAIVPEASPVRFEVETTLPTVHGTFTLRAYRDRSTGADHVAIMAGDSLPDEALVRVHSECLTGEALGSLKCECGPQLSAALETIQREGAGAVIYMRGHEGRGIGLINKLRAYRLQEGGLDTLDANVALGLPADGRDYRAAAAIIKDLGANSVRLLTNNPNKGAQLERHGVTVSRTEPLIVGLGELNQQYMNVKRDRMGHRLPEHLVIPAEEN
ncbi:MAG TPA: GTP cyclohydrolase II [Candidatus Agrococcus pullicola]|uniref:GTP cyclohydrolase-2 n=1 Tax=Candidatus Agrococcus pullicola TaxID=2838429 RepID=A0A9D2CAQ3_9MICO|nr:GTP cyclohydrolase II [Candidatus Agrococcus pullicola]